VDEVDALITQVADENALNLAELLPSLKSSSPEIVVDQIQSTGKKKAKREERALV